MNLSRLLERHRFRPWARAWAARRMARLIRAQGFDEIGARCTVDYRVCMEEAGLAWQDCPATRCGPPGIPTLRVPALPAPVNGSHA